MDSQFSKSRRSLRLKEYDYRNAGAYFVTVCTQDRVCLFGKIEAGQKILNDAGLMISSVWNELPHYIPEFKIDEYVVMPNHFHGILWKIDHSVGVGPCAYPQAGHPRGDAPTSHAKESSLFNAIYQFKSLSTNKYIHGVKNNNWVPFNKRLWQRNYYERVIRNDEELNAIRQYIIDNPKNWNEDKYNPNILTYRKG